MEGAADALAGCAAGKASINVSLKAAEREAEETAGTRKRFP